MIITFKKLSKAQSFARVNSLLMSELAHETIESEFNALEAWYSIPAISPMRYSMFAPYSQIKLTMDGRFLLLQCRLSFWILVPAIAVLTLISILQLKRELQFNDALMLGAFGCFVTGLALFSSYIRIKIWLNAIA